MIHALHRLSFTLCLAAFVCFVVGCVGFDDRASSVINVSWFVYDEDRWFALRGYAYKVHGNAKYGDYSDNCNDDTCDNCDVDGKWAFGLMVAAVVFTAACSGLGGGLLATVSNTLMLSNVVAAFFAFAASLASLWIFMSGCYGDLKDSVPHEDKLDWGTGAIVSTIGMLLMLLVTLLQAGTWLGLWKC